MRLVLDMLISHEVCLKLYQMQAEGSDICRPSLGASEGNILIRISIKRWHIINEYTRQLIFVTTDITIGRVTFSAKCKIFQLERITQSFVANICIFRCVKNNDRYIGAHQKLLSGFFRLRREYPPSPENHSAKNPLAELGDPPPPPPP